jgi:hypothetical protein
MEIKVKVPDLAPVKAAIHEIELKPQVFFVVGFVLAVLAVFFPKSSTGLGIAAGAALLSAAWGQSIIMGAFFKRATSMDEPADDLTIHEPIAPEAGASNPGPEPPSKPPTA